MAFSSRHYVYFSMYHPPTLPSLDSASCRSRFISTFTKLPPHMVALPSIMRRQCRTIRVVTTIIEFQKQAASVKLINTAIDCCHHHALVPIAVATIHYPYIFSPSYPLTFRYRCHLQPGRRQHDPPVCWVNPNVWTLPRSVVAAVSPPPIEDHATWSIILQCAF